MCVEVVMPPSVQNQESVCDVGRVSLTYICHATNLKMRTSAVLRATIWLDGYYEVTMPAR